MFKDKDFLVASNGDYIVRKGHWRMGIGWLTAVHGSQDDSDSSED